ncbi:hypothetical protein FAI40_08215 [Acetobacteraceae bacterium]|nr:hypothetical protein FAI40_08215 [Acetobacteraceae bacterium]
MVRKSAETIQKFKILSSFDIAELEQEVNQHLQDGWFLLPGGYQTIQESARVEISPDEENPQNGMSSRTCYTTKFTIALYQ